MIRFYANYFASISMTLGLVSLPMLDVAAESFIVFGASGHVGGAIVEEALSRGHDIIGVSRNPANLANEHPRFTSVVGDVTDPRSVAEIVSDADTVVIAVNGIGEGNTPEEATTSRAARAYIEVAGQLGESTPYVIQVGGGTTLFTDGVFGLDAFELQAGTRRHGLWYGNWQALESYGASEGFDWVVMTGARGALTSSERTGRYRLGGEETLFDRNGSSYLSREDFAIAVVDMAENHAISGRRVAVGPPH